MELTYQKATEEDIEPIFQLCQKLIRDYEDPQTIDFEKVFRWVRRKIEASIDEYTAIFADGRKSGYYHFFRNEDQKMELDDLYVFPEFQSRGIGSEVVKRCCRSVREPVMLYVFVKNVGAVALYKRLGFAVTETLGATRYIMEFQQKQ